MFSLALECLILLAGLENGRQLLKGRNLGRKRDAEAITFLKQMCCEKAFLTWNLADIGVLWVHF